MEAVATEKKLNIEPKFRDPATMTEEELTDPDYHLKQIAKLTRVSPESIVNCSKCHHCR